MPKTLIITPNGEPAIEFPVPAQFHVKKHKHLIAVEARHKNIEVALCETEIFAQGLQEFLIPHTIKDTIVRIPKDGYTIEVI